ncbi:MAG: NAD-dependent epimerase/dehydratase family protein [Burkholderiales bacterium]
MLEHLNSSASSPQRVVIVGAGGFVGGAIRRKLVQENIRTVALTRKEIDLLAPDAQSKLEKTLEPGDSVVFVSAIAPVKTVPMLMQNLRMAEVACAALAERAIGHLLYISSDAVYADDANPVTENSYVAPSTLHGMMHAARELMLKSATSAPFAALRPTLIYGADDPHNGYGPNRFRRQAQQGQSITIFGEGEERRDHVHVDDVARLAVLMLKQRSRGALNAVTGTSVSFHDIAHMTAALFKNDVSVESVPRPGPRPHLLHRFFDITECRKAFPAFQYVPLAQGLPQSVRMGSR